MHKNPVKQALSEGRLQLGCGFGFFRSPEVPRMLMSAGFQWAFIDTEHGGFDLETVQDICRVSNLIGFVPVVRVADLQYPLVSRALDVGAGGIIFPRVESPEILEKAVSWTKFPPVGIRGYGLTAVNTDYEPLSIAQVMEHSNANTLVCFQIETKKALEAREELLSVPGIDAVMIGPADLSISLGVPGDFQHPKMVEAMEAIRDSCVRHKIAPGTQTRTPALARFWKERGMIFLGCSSDSGMLLDRAAELSKMIKAE
jgi:2-dehydro-3-deoxyglucarate aldolase/4-hydroxy-2-oxoheptanedioate aldolase